MQQKIDLLLRQLGISFKQYAHPALDSCQDADRFNLQRSGFRLKNLFLRDNYGRHHLLVLVPHTCRVDLKQLSIQLSLSRIGFCSERRLQQYLGCRPGHLSLLALMNDSQHKVTVYVDKQVWMQPSLQCHPLDNQFTYVVSHQDIKKFLAYTGHKAHVIDVPKLN